MDKEILHETKRFDVVRRESKVGIEIKKVTVGVLPYVISDGLLSSVGVLHEYSSFRKGNYCDTIITGTLEPDDESLLSCAIRELEEEGGFIQQDVDKWIFLGCFKLSKGSTEEINVFGCDVSNLEQGEAKGDGSKKEKLSSLRMTQINDAILTDESIFLASYLRLFDFFYQNNTKS